MIACCSKSKHAFWISFVIATFIGCGMLLYVSYHYTSKNQSSRKNSEGHNDIRSEKLTQASCHDVCLSKECVLAANYLFETMDPDVDPCDDFYSFSCGNWMKKFSDHDNYTVIQEMETQLKKTLKDLLDNLKVEESRKSEKLKIVYDSCMNKDSSEYNAIRTIKEFLHGIGIEGWPELAPTFHFAESSMERTLARLAAYNQISLIKFFPTELEEEGGGLFNITVRNDSPFVHDVSEWKLYQTVIAKIMSLFGTSSQSANDAWEDFRRVDTEIHKLFMESSSTDEETSQYINCKSETSDKLELICNALKYFVKYSGISGRFYEDRAYFPKSQYLENILPLMRNFTQRQVANYLSLRFILNQLDVLSLPFRSLLTSSPELDSQLCVGWMSRYMSHAVAQKLVAELPSGQLEEMPTFVQTYIQEATIYVSNQKWIEESSRIKLENSIRNISDSMKSFLSNLLKPSTYDLIIDDYNPTNESFLQNVLEYNKNILKLYMFHYQALQTEEFPQDFFKVAAFHSAGSLDIRFGMFLPPVYKYGLPKLLNLATMGSAIGHEIGHEIDLFFEETLNEDLKKRYQEKKACLEEQFSQYEVQKIGKKVKGNQTIDENMADLIGMEITQQVIDKYSTPDDLLLPGLNFSTRQILYLSQAQMWCSVRSKDNEQLHYDEDVHSPNEVRVNGILRNLPEFSKEYKCSTNSTMNMIKRCSIRV